MGRAKVACIVGWKSPQDSKKCDIIDKALFIHVYFLLIWSAWESNLHPCTISNFPVNYSLSLIFLNLKFKPCLRQKLRAYFLSFLNRRWNREKLRKMTSLSLQAKGVRRHASRPRSAVPPEAKRHQVPKHPFRFSYRAPAPCPIGCCVSAVFERRLVGWPGLK